MSLAPTLRQYLKPGRYAWSDAYHESPHAENACIVCGKRTVAGSRVIVCLTGGGDVLVRPDDMEREEREHPGNFMGTWPVGPECGKSIPQEYRCTEVTA